MVLVVDVNAGHDDDVFKVLKSEDCPSCSGYSVGSAIPKP